jgi:hypothetical protein
MDGAAMKLARGIGIVGGVAVAGAFALSALATDPRQGICTSRVAAPVRAAIAMDRASDYKRHLPKMGYSPELEQGAPAYLVAFGGDASITVMGAPAPDGGGSSGVADVSQAVFTGVVCVVVDGAPIMYVNVDQTGLN